MSAARRAATVSAIKLSARLAARFIAAAVLVLSSTAAFSQSSPAPYTTGYRYDLGRHLVGTIAPDPDGAGPLHFAATRNTYDSTGVLTRVEIGELAAWESEAVAPSAWTGFTIFRVIDYTYDASGRKLSEQTSSAGTGYTLTQYSYDSIGRPDCAAVRMNPSVFASLIGASSACSLGTQGTYGPDRITRTYYDAANRPLSIVKAYLTSNQLTYASYTYVGGHVATVTDANGNMSTMTVDGLARQYQLIFPSATSTGQSDSSDYEQYGYDNNNNRVSLRKRDGQSITYSYDHLNRETLTHYPTGTLSDVSYTYDLRNLQLTATFSSGAGITTTYDGFGHAATSSTNQSGTTRTLSYQYDADGDRVRLTHPDGAYFVYSYDGLDRLNQITENGSAVLAAIVYDSQGRRSSLTRGGGATTTTYGYDPVSRLQSYAHNLDGTGTTYDDTRTFTYNPAHQIATRNLSNGVYSFAVTPNVANTYTVNGLNQYTNIAASPTVTPSYDSRGNLTFDGATTYGYDIENRLTSATGAHTASLVYDPQGRLYQTSGGSFGTTIFLYDANELVAEYDSSGTLLRRYVHGSAVDEPIVSYEGAAVSSTTRRYLHADHQGSIVALTNGSGTTMETETYDAYGMPAAGNHVRFQYTGQIGIPEIGLYYYKARIYNPGLGRFLQTDPVGYKDDLDLYTYVGNDPFNRSDPSGMRCEQAASGAECHIDEFRDAKGNVISREEATKGGNWLTKLLKIDPASRVARQERAMTEKYKSALKMADRGASVTIKGDPKLGVPSQTITGGQIVKAMETTKLEITAQGPPDPSLVAFTGKTATGTPTRIVFFSGGNLATNFARTFGHEELHAAYTWPSATDRGWDSDGKAYQAGHQVPFDDASDQIR